VLAPEVNVDSLVIAKNYKELTRFERETKLETKQNHLTGYLQAAEQNTGRFYEQYHAFENQGQALNPSDGAGIYSSALVGVKRTFDAVESDD